MSIKRIMTLAAPLSDSDGLRSLIAFSLDYIYIDSDRLRVSVNPSGRPTMSIYPAGAVDDDGIAIVAGKNRIVLNTTQTTKVSNFIQAVEDAYKTNLDTAWP